MTAAIAAPAMPASSTSTSSTVAAMLMRLIAICTAERQPGARLSDQPAEHDIIGQRQRRRPDPDGEVGPRGAGDAFAAAHRAEQDRGERHLQHDQRRADQGGDDEAAHQDRAQFLRSRRRRATAR